MHLTYPHSKPAREWQLLDIQQTVQTSSHAPAASKQSRVICQCADTAQASDLEQAPQQENG